MREEGGICTGEFGEEDGEWGVDGGSGWVGMG